MGHNLRGRDSRPNRLEIRLSDAELEELEQLCLRLDRSASAVMRLALAALVEQGVAHAPRKAEG
jgi:predicted transcriptional regulator